MTLSKKATRVIAIAPLLASPIVHFLPPTAPIFDSMVPNALPGKKRTWTILSGLVELVTGLLAANKSTRRLGATLAAVLYIAVWPGNFKMAYDWRGKPWYVQAIAIGRLPLQLPLIWAALKVRRESD